MLLLQGAVRTGRRVGSCGNILQKAHHQNRVEVRIKQAAVELGISNPALGQVRVSNESRKQDILASPGGVRSIWQRNDMEIFQKRLKALSSKVSQEGIILSEEQVAALEKAKVEKETHGEIEAHHPCYQVKSGMQGHNLQVLFFVDNGCNDSITRNIYRCTQHIQRPVDS
ncbi:MAG: hypothetical protein LBL90_10295 [Prevotellaceae bacterium]|nr:hypothetical protein [Prevotellaceae bacterium]